MKPAFTLSQEIGRIPFLRLTVPLIAGIVVADRLDIAVGVLLGSAVALLVGGALFRDERVRAVLLVALLVYVGILSVKVRVPAENIPRGQRLLVRGVVTDHVSSPVAGRWQRSTARLEVFREWGDIASVWQPTRENILIYIDTAYRLVLGEQFAAVGYVNSLDSTGSSGYARTMHARGITGRFYMTTGGLVESSPADHLTLWQKTKFLSKRIQKSLCNRLATLDMDHREEGVAMALIAGYTHELEAPVRDAYSRSGTSHVLAVSGLHLGILFLILQVALTPLLALRRGYLWRSWAIALCLWGYAFITGLSPSVLRSAFMLSMLQFSLMTVWRYNSYNALFSSAFVLLLINPYYLYDISFQMSYLAVFSILFFYPRFNRWFGARSLERKLTLCEEHSRGIMRAGWWCLRSLFSMSATALLIGLAAQIAVAPLVGYTFGRIPLLALLINPVVVPLVTVIMTVALAYLMLGGIPLLGGWIGEVTAVLFRWQNKLVYWTASSPGASVEQVAFSGTMLLVVYALLIFVLLFIKWQEQTAAKPTAQ
ncbi:MAG: ComEC/Rec2 family competence protein [Rikenellaceae bacterium]|jgi:competence protein ComEC|nr:ComEC/Rec2 family competence protein [Rikenellaceae bacterium]